MPLLMTMMALTLLTGLGTVLVVGTMTETAVTAAYRRALEAFYAADAVVEFAIRDLAMRDDWDAVLSGAETSTLVDGAPAGTRYVGTTAVDFVHATAEVDMLLAARATPPSATSQMFAYGRFEDLVAPTEAAVPAYVCVWVAEPVTDEEEVPPVRLLYVVGRAYGATGGRRTVLVTVARPLDPAELGTLQVRSWEEPQ